MLAPNLQGVWGQGSPPPPCRAAGSLGRAPPPQGAATGVGGAVRRPYRATSAELRGLTLNPEADRPRGVCGHRGCSPRQAHSREAQVPSSRRARPLQGWSTGACDTNCLHDASPVTCQVSGPVPSPLPSPGRRGKGCPSPQESSSSEFGLRKPPLPSPSGCGAALSSEHASSHRLTPHCVSSEATQVAETGIVMVPASWPRDTHGPGPIPSLSQGTQGQKQTPPSHSPGRPWGVRAAAPGGGR